MQTVSPTRGRPAIFLDRDGTIIVERDYLADPKGVALLAGAGEALRSLVRAGWILVMVTNQSGVERGYFGLTEVDAVNRRVQDLLAPYGVGFEAIYICPHGPDSDCACRKPAPGMLLSAATEHAIDLSRSFLVGDKLSDLEAAANAGSTGILVKTGHGTAAEEAARAFGWTVVADLAEAAAMMPAPTAAT